LRRWALIAADSLRLLCQLPAASVDAVITDPPYGLAFKEEAWDSGELATPDGLQAFSRAWAEQARLVLRPGGHLLCFGSPRTFHRLVAGVEDAGLEIRDVLLWLHAAGVPKSMRLAGGRGTALKPAYEPILLARAPLPAGSTVSGTIARYGTGALNIDATRPPRPTAEEGYWPSHLLLAHGEDCASREAGGTGCQADCPVPLIDWLGGGALDGSLSRLFYAAKASRAEREAGCQRLPVERAPTFSGPKLSRPRANVHPTVKPLDLMRWLVRLSAPPGGVVLDPFTGSGSTGCAAVLEERQFIGIDRDERYLPIARARLTHWTQFAATTLSHQTDNAPNR